MVSDAIIVAGGLGTRMLPASGSCAKEGLPLVDVPAIRHLLLEAIEAGCDRLHLILSPNKLELGERVGADRATTAHLLEKRPDIHPSLIGPLPAEVSLEIHVQPIANGLGGAIAVALPMIDGPFLVLLGDNLLLDRHVPPDHQWVASRASMHLVEAHHRTGRPVAGIHEVPGSEVSQYGVVALEGEMIRDLIEKPPERKRRATPFCVEGIFGPRTQQDCWIGSMSDHMARCRRSRSSVTGWGLRGGMWPSHSMNSNGTTVVPPYLG